MKVYSQVNKKFNKNVHQTLGINYYDLLTRMRAPTGVYRSNVYKTTRKPKPLAEMKKNYAILKKYYTIITRNTKYTASHPTMRAFRLKLNEYRKHIDKTINKKRKPVKAVKPRWRY